MTRDRLLALAGITEKDLADDVRLARCKLLDLLDAKETRYYQHEGQVRDEREVESRDIQRKAAKDLLDLAGGLNTHSVNKSSVNAPTKVVIYVEKQWVTTTPEDTIIDAVAVEEVDPVHDRSIGDDATP